jgi:hypothetical protein
MTNTFINQLKQKHLKEQEQTQKRKEVSNRIHELASKGNSYNWGVINELKKDVAPVSNAVMDNETAHQEFMKYVDSQGLGGDEGFYERWEQALGTDRYNDSYFKRMLTYALEYTINKIETKILGISAGLLPQVKKLTVRDGDTK